MGQEKIFSMPFSRVYPLLVAKAERKGRRRDEVDLVTCWMTGYSPEDIAAALSGERTYGDFFRLAPAPNPDRLLVNGTVCGIRVETIEDQLMREVRCLDKLVDELAHGKPMEKILRKPKEKP